MQKKMISLCLVVVMMCFCWPSRAWAAEIVKIPMLHTANVVSNVDSNNTQWTTIVLTSENGTKAAPGLTTCSIGITPMASGLYVDFQTYCSEQAEEVGVMDVKIQKKVGIFWSTVATSEGGYQSDTSGYGGHLLYANAEYGETYRVSCVHYAYCGGYDLRADNVTGGKKHEY